MEPQTEILVSREVVPQVKIEQDEEVKIDPTLQTHQTIFNPQENQLVNPFDNTALFSGETLKLETSMGIVGYAMQYIEDEQLFCVGTKDGNLLVYNALDFKLLKVHTSVHKGWIISLYYASMLKLLFTTSSDMMINVFRIEKENLVEVAKLEGHKDNVNAVVVLPKAHILFSIGRDPDIKIWDLNSLKLKDIIPTGEGGMGCSIIHIEEMNCVGVSFFSGNIKFYNIVSKECVYTINTQNKDYYINSLLYLPKRKWVVAQISPKEIKVWKKEQNEFIAGEKIRTEGHANFVYIDENEITIVFACNKPYLDVQELQCFTRKNKIDLKSTPLKNSNGMVYLASLSKLVVSAWNCPYLYILKPAQPKDV